MFTGGQNFAAGGDPYVGPIYIGSYAGYVGTSAIAYGSDQYIGPTRQYGTGSSDPEGYEDGYLMFSRNIFLDAYQWDVWPPDIYNPGGPTYVGAPDYFGATYLIEYVHGDSPSYLGPAYLASGYITHYTSPTLDVDGQPIINTYIKTVSKSYESLGSTVEYGSVYVGEYAGDFDGFFEGAEFNVFYESEYETDYIKDYINHFLGETIQATSSDVETYTLYVRIS